MWCSAVGFIVTLTLSLLAAPLTVTVTAQPRSTVPRIGILAPGPGTITEPDPLWEAFRQGLRDLGYVEGKNIVLEYRFMAVGQHERLPALADELVQLPVDVLVTAGSGAPAATHATATLPIVFTVFADPVGEGLVASLARPGGTVTGNAILYAELSTKRLELLKDVVPGLSRVVVLWNAANPANASVWKETQAAARALGLLLHSQEVRGAQDFEGVFALTAQAHPDALLVLDDALINRVYFDLWYPGPPMKGGHSHGEFAIHRSPDPPSRGAGFDQSDPG